MALIDVVVDLFVCSMQNTTENSLNVIAIGQCWCCRAANCSSSSSRLSTSTKAVDVD